VSAHAIAAQLARSAGEHLGDVVWSDVEIGDALIDRREIRALLNEAGLDEDIQPDDVTSQHAFGRAVSAFESDDAFLLKRAEKRSRDVLLFAIDGKALARRDEAIALVRSTADGVEVEWNESKKSPEAEACVARFRQLWERYRHYIDAAEFQATVRHAIIEWFGGTRIRRHGSVYWCPRSSSRELRRFVDVVEQVGQCTMPVLEVHDSARNRESTGRQLEAAFAGELSKLQSELAAYARASTTRESTLEGQLGKLDELRGRVTVARHVLEARAEKLLEVLALAEEHAKRAIAGDRSWADLDSDAPASAPQEQSDTVPSSIFDLAAD
jgi:hypothetical protein